jgi:hypothetical protein
MVHDPFDGWRAIWLTDGKQTPQRSPFAFEEVLLTSPFASDGGRIGVCRLARAIAHGTLLPAQMLIMLLDQAHSALII